MNRRGGAAQQPPPAAGMEGYVLRAQGQDDAKRRAQRIITAVQEASLLAGARGWLG